MVVRDRFEMLFEHSVDGVFVMTLDEPIAWQGAPDQDALLDHVFEHLRMTSVNRVLCEQLGTPREQLIGTVPRQRWNSDVDIWRARMRRLFEDGRTFFTMRAARPDGRWLDVEGQYVCSYDEQGRITGCFGTQRDITDKRKTAERLELAMESADIGIWDLDLVSQALYFDEQFTLRMGYSLDDERVRDARFWGTCMHASDLHEVRQEFETHLRGDAPFRVEHRLRAATGEWRWFLSSGRVTTRDDHGRPVRMVGCCVDVTERKLLQERLFLAERMASIGTLAAGVGHEINNPLTYIVLNLTLIERELKTLVLPSASQARLAHMVDQARYGTERVSGIVRDLQALTRVPEQRVGRVELVPVLERCLEIADHQIRHRARVIRELAPVPRVRGSEGRIVQLFLNLLVNAAQAIPIGSADTNWIKVTTRAEKWSAVVEIADSGIGIAPDVMGRIFDPFFTTKQIGEGTGLGLAICRSIVTAMGGEISVDSTPGTGSTFRVVLPASETIELPVVALEPTITEPPKKRLLVIDDEPLVGQLVAKVLTSHDVTAETSARAALVRLRSGESFDLILCDLIMPEVSGIDFYEQLGQVDPLLRHKVVFLSGGAFTDRAQS
ncbi:MAG TPA: ATP-binding protein, partial [Kofleriaceae bacterium]|nr:ATP-binding protein [Kofleriaceae bacterium]